MRIPACLAVTLFALSAHASELRFSATAPGGVVAVGNTLGLSKDTALNGPGVRDSIGTFTSLAATVDDVPANAANPYPSGTTSDWQQNGSAATLSLREGNKLELTDVLYAELVWGGSTNYVEDVTALLDTTSVTLSTDGASISVAPDPATALTIAQAATGFTANYYMRSADVTDFVRAHRSGVYEVRGVPATQNEVINTLNAAGWTLIVVFRDDAEPLRNLTVFVGGSFVDENTQEDYEVSGFCAPPSGVVVGAAAFSAIEGDANLAGDQFLIAPTIADAFVPLDGANNPANNFFCSQINGVDGALDTSGTFGGRNHDAAAGVNVVGGRQGWDVTMVPLSSVDGQLFAAQQSAVLRTITTGDSFVPTLAAFQIDVNAPNLTSSSLVPDQLAVGLGDALVVTSVARNSGLADASALEFQLAVPAGLALERFSSDGVDGDIQGAAVNAASLAAGVDEGVLAPGEERTVVAELRVVDVAPSGSFFFQPVWSYDYVTCDGSLPLSESYSRSDVVDFIEPPPTPDAGVVPDPDAGPPADAGGGGSDDDAGLADAGGGLTPDAGPEGTIDLGPLPGGDDPGAVEGCGCSSSPGSAGVAALCLGVLFLLPRVRRRRR